VPLGRIEHNSRSKPGAGANQLNRFRVQLALLKRATSPNNNHFRALKAFLSDPNFKQIFDKLSTENKQFLLGFIKKYKQQIFGSAVPKYIEEILNPRTRRAAKPRAAAPGKVRAGQGSKNIARILGRLITPALARLAQLQKNAGFLPSIIQSSFKQVLKNREARLQKDIQILKDPKSSPAARSQAQNRIMASVHILGQIENYYRSAVYLKKAAKHRRIPSYTRGLIDKNLALAGKLVLQGKFSIAQQILGASHSYIIARRARKYSLGNVYYRGLKTNNLSKKLGYFTLGNVRASLFKMKSRVKRGEVGRRNQRAFNKTVRKAYYGIYRRLKATLRSGRQITTQDESYIEGRMKSVQTEFIRLQKLAYQNRINSNLRKLARYSRIGIKNKFRAPYTQVASKAKAHFERALSLAKSGNYAESQRAYMAGQQLLVRLQIFHAAHSVRYKSYLYAQRLGSLLKQGASARGVRHLRGYMYSRHGYSALGQLRGSVLDTSTNLQKIIKKFKGAVRWQNIYGRIIHRRKVIFLQANAGIRCVDGYLKVLSNRSQTKHISSTTISDLRNKLTALRSQLSKVREQALKGSYRQARANMNKLAASLKGLGKRLDLEVTGRKISKIANGFLRKLPSLKRKLLSKIGKGHTRRQILARIAVLRKYTTVKNYTPKQVREFNQTIGALRKWLKRAAVLYALISVRRGLDNLTTADQHYGTFGRVLKNPLAAAGTAGPAHALGTGRYRGVRSALDVHREMNNPRLIRSGRLHQKANALAGFIAKFDKGHGSAVRAQRLLNYLRRDPLIRRRMSDVGVGYSVLSKWEAVRPYLAVVGMVFASFIPFFHTAMESGFGSSPQFRKGKSAKWTTIALDSLLVLGYAAAGLRIAASGAALSRVPTAVGGAANAAKALKAAQGAQAMLGTGRVMRSLQALRSLTSLKALRAANLGSRSLQVLASGVGMLNTAGMVTAPAILGYTVYENWNKMGTVGKTVGIGFTLLSAVLVGRGFQTGQIQRAFRADAFRMKFAFMSNSQISARLNRLGATVNGHLKDLAQLRARGGEKWMDGLMVPQNAASFRKVSHQFEELAVLMEAANSRGLASFGRAQINAVRGMGINFLRMSGAVNPGRISRIGARIKQYIANLGGRVQVVPGNGATPRPQAGGFAVVGSRGSGSTGMVRSGSNGVGLQRYITPPVARPAHLQGVNPTSLYISIGGARVEVRPGQTVQIPNQPFKIKYHMMFSVENLPTGWKMLVNGREVSFAKVFGVGNKVAIVKPDGTRIEFSPSIRMMQYPNGATVPALAMSRRYPFQLPDVPGRPYRGVMSKIHAPGIMAHGTNNLKSLVSIAIDRRIYPSVSDNHVHRGWMAGGSMVDGKTSARQHGPFYVVLKGENLPSKGQIGSQHHAAYLVPDAASRRLFISAIDNAQQHGLLTPEAARAIKARVYTYSDYARLNPNFKFVDNGRAVSGATPRNIGTRSMSMSDSEFNAYLLRETRDCSSGSNNYGFLFSDTRSKVKAGEIVTDIILNHSLKAVNDQYGHQAGDMLLAFVNKNIKEVAARHGLNVTVGKEGPNFTIRINGYKPSDHGRVVAFMKDLKRHFANVKSIPLKNQLGHDVNFIPQGGLQVNLTGYTYKPRAAHAGKFTPTKWRTVNRYYITRANSGVSEFALHRVDPAKNYGIKVSERVNGSTAHIDRTRTIDAWPNQWRELLAKVSRDTGLPVTSDRVRDAARQIYLEPETGLLNKKGFMYLAKQRIAAAKASGEKLVVIFFDGNKNSAFFKPSQDGGFGSHLGNAYVDAIIQRRYVEAAKKVFGDAVFSRMGTGSEEFFVLMPANKSAAAMRRFQAELGKPLRFKTKVGELLKSSNGRAILRANRVRLSDPNRVVEVDLATVFRGPSRQYSGISVTGASKPYNHAKTLEQNLHTVDVVTDAAKAASPGKGLILKLDGSGRITGRLGKSGPIVLDGNCRVAKDIINIRKGLLRGQEMKVDGNNIYILDVKRRIVKKYRILENRVVEVRVQRQKINGRNVANQ